MTSPTTSPAIDDPEPTHDAPRRRRFFLVVTTVVVGALIAGWLYILFGYDPARLIDELEDPAFPTAAEEVCARARVELEALPPAQTAADAQERADAVERSNVILASMVAQLRPLTPTSPEQVRDGVTEWIDDWAVYVDNRERYVDSLRVDDEARFLEPSKGSPTKGITRAINGFAEVNEMDSCTTPGDLS